MIYIFELKQDWAGRSGDYIKLLGREVAMSKATDEVKATAGATEPLILLGHTSDYGTLSIELIDLNTHQSVKLRDYMVAPPAVGRDGYVMRSYVTKVVTPTTTTTYRHFPTWSAKDSSPDLEIKATPTVTVYLETPSVLEKFGAVKFVECATVDTRTSAGTLQDGRRCWYTTNADSTAGYQSMYSVAPAKPITPAFLIISPKPVVTVTAAKVATDDSLDDGIYRNRGEIKIPLKESYGNFAFLHELPR
jgi:hypothetical protein